MSTSTAKRSKIQCAGRVDGKVSIHPNKLSGECQICNSKSYTWEITCRHNKYVYVSEYNDMVFNPFNMYLCDKCFESMMLSFNDKVKAVAE